MTDGAWGRATATAASAPLTRTDDKQAARYRYLAAAAAADAFAAPWTTCASGDVLQSKGGNLLAPAPT